MAADQAATEWLVDSGANVVVVPKDDRTILRRLNREKEIVQTSAGRVYGQWVWARTPLGNRQALELENSPRLLPESLIWKNGSYSNNKGEVQAFYKGRALAIRIRRDLPYLSNVAVARRGRKLTESSAQGKLAGNGPANANKQLLIESPAESAAAGFGRGCPGHTEFVVDNARETRVACTSGENPPRISENRSLPLAENIAGCESERACPAGEIPPCEVSVYVAESGVKERSGDAVYEAPESGCDGVIYDANESERDAEAVAADGARARDKLAAQLERCLQVAGVSREEFTASTNNHKRRTLRKVHVRACVVKRLVAFARRAMHTEHDASVNVQGEQMQGSDVIPREAPGDICCQAHYSDVITRETSAPLGQNHPNGPNVITRETSAPLGQNHPNGPNVATRETLMTLGQRMISEIGQACEQMHVPRETPVGSDEARGSYTRPLVGIVGAALRVACPTYSDSEPTHQRREQRRAEKRERKALKQLNKRKGKLAESHHLSHFPHDPDCPVCARVKQQAGRFKRGKALQAHQFPGETLYAMDIKTNLVSSHPWYTGPKDNLLVVRNVKTKALFCYPLSGRGNDEVRQGIHWIRVEDGTDQSPIVVSCDREGAWTTSTATAAYMRNNQMRLVNSVPGRSTTNARAEEAVRRVAEGTVCLLVQSGLPMNFWPYAAQTFCAHHNRALPVPNNCVPRVNELNPVCFGVQGVAVLPEETRYRQNLDARGTVVANLGPDLSTRYGWRVLFRDGDGRYRTTTVRDADVKWGKRYAFTANIRNLRHVLKLATPDESLKDADEELPLQAVEEPEVERRAPREEGDDESEASPDALDGLFIDGVEPQDTDSVAGESDGADGPDLADLLDDGDFGDDEPEVHACQLDTSLRGRVQDVLARQQSELLSDDADIRELVELAPGSFVTRLCTPAEKRTPMAREAQAEEILKVLGFNTIELTPVTEDEVRKHYPDATFSGVFLITSKKHVEKSESEHKWKGRLVLAGNQIYRVLDWSQVRPSGEQHGIFGEVTSLDGFRSVLAWGLRGDANGKRFPVECADLSNAYLNADWPSSLPAHFLTVPPEVLDHFPPHAKYKAACLKGKRVLWRMTKALYGHPLSGHLWITLLEKHLEEGGWTRVAGVPSLFERGESRVCGYVDDLMIAGPQGEVSDFWREIAAKFKIGRKGPVDEFLGCQVRECDSGDFFGYALDQREYIDSIVKTTEERFEQELTRYRGEVPKAATPMSDELRILDPKVTDPEKRVLKVLGMLLWLARMSRPDIALSVSRLASRVARWDDSCLAQLLRVVGYIRFTREETLVFRRHKDDRWSDLQCNLYTDSNLSTPRSQSGLALSLQSERGTNILIGWGSTKQGVVANSTGIAELFAAHHGLRECYATAVALECGSPRLLVDNSTVLRVAARGASPSFRMYEGRPVRISVALLRDLSSLGALVVAYVNTEKQLADPFTKALERTKLERARNMLGMLGPTP